MTFKTTDRRVGFTLIEVVGVIALVAVLLNLSIAVLYSITKWGRQSEQTTQQAASRYRMEIALRDQLSAATSAEADGGSLVIIMPSARSQWQLEHDGCLLTINSNGETRHDRFVIGPFEQWQLDEGPNAWELRLVGRSETNGWPLRIDVAKAMQRGEP